MCAGCPVRQECLNDALDHFEKHGCWGGLAPRERRPLQRTHIVIRSCVVCGTDYRARNKIGRNPPSLFSTLLRSLDLFTKLER